MDSSGRAKGEPKGSEKGWANLIPMNQRSPEDVRRICKMGAKATSQKKRRQRTFRESVVALMKCEVLNEEQKKVLEEMGLDPTTLNQIQVAVFEKAAKGDVEAARYLRDTAGEKPRDGVEIGNLEGKPLASIDLSGMTDDQLKALAAQRSEEPEEG